MSQVLCLGLDPSCFLPWLSLVLSFLVPPHSLLIWFCPLPWLSVSSLVCFNRWCVCIYSSCVSPVSCQFAFLSPYRNVPALIHIVPYCFQVIDITRVPTSLPTCSLSGVFASLTVFLCAEPISQVKNIALPYHVSCRAIVSELLLYFPRSWYQVLKSLVCIQHLELKVRLLIYNYLIK